MKSLYITVNIGHGLLVLLVDASSFDVNVKRKHDRCPPWTRPVNTTDDNITCECGDNLGGIISCDNETKEVFVSVCCCVTRGKQHDQIVAGACPYSCFYTTSISGIKYQSFYLLPRNKSDLSDEVYRQWNRRGQLCGRCKKGYAPPILGYELGCMECNDTESVSGAIKFVAAGILPPTILFFLVIALQLHTNSPKLIGFIFFAQLVASPPDYLPW